MIEKLLIKNYLIIKEIEIEFSDGLNILTGETGAGKSIILDAISMILGERADYSLIKDDQDKLIVEAHLNLKDKEFINKLLREIIPDEESEMEYLILRREILKKGISRNFINDTPVNNSDMKRIGDTLVDIHSQNEHQSLLSKETHQDILDNFLDEQALFSEYDYEFKIFSEMILKHKEMVLKKDEFISRKSFIEYQLKEINNLSLSEDEDIQLENELNKMENSEVISIAVNNSVNLLYENDLNALSEISASLKELRKVSGYDNSLENVIKDLENAEILVKESAETLSRNVNELDFDNNKIEQLRNRLASITQIKKKYNLGIKELLIKAEELKRELNIADNFDYESSKILEKIYLQKEKVYKIAKKISDLRKKKSSVLEKEINSIFNEIGLESSEFKTEIKNIKGDIDDMFSYAQKNGTVKLGKSGFDDIEFLVKINKGSEFSPLRKSASGGEISRIMLAIKTVLSEKSRIPILIFDEIDSGISGRIAQKAGKILKKLSQTHQIICITHLPQIAAMSKRHFHVSKKDEKGITTAYIKSLNEEEKLTEVAKLISGEKITEYSKKSASELIRG